ncbi:HNH endonuclease signature motif containing protein [Nakamurella panacisegetis]|uniref:HNH endonuclease signature motif containing protein n=1 Tax=Nakamurella panacisegetis TaxID=1090615 RepID=UPI000AA52B22|nr:HNH endonuclease signature motif containing protein [Nakamurella panacisegetis]
MLACDSRVLPAVMRGKTELLEMGRSMRAFNAATGAALLLRDRGCVFPGCDIPGQWAERHHIRHWADGGPSDYGNGCLLCRRHHSLVHQGDWEVLLDTDGTARVKPPGSVDPQRRPLRNTLHRPPEFPWPGRGGGATIA